MSALAVYEYAVLRLVPRVERGECINVGLLLYCRERDLLLVRTRHDDERLRLLDPTLDTAVVRDHLLGLAQLASDSPDAGAAQSSTLGERFRWLTSPRSTVVQPGPVHSGLAADPAAELARLAEAFLDPPRR